MSCLPEYLEVIQGEERTLPLKIQKKNGASFSLTGVSEITVKLKNQDGTVLSKTMTGLFVTVIDAAAGRYTVLLSETETSLLKKGDRQDFTVDFQFGTVLRKANYYQSLTVKAASV